MHRKVQTDQPSDRHTKDQIPRPNHLGDIARDHGEEYIKIYKPPLQHIKYIRALRVCKTPALGGKIVTCKKCGEEHHVYFSCGHSSCAICQSIKREQLMDKLSRELLNVPYVHLVTTQPREFARLSRENPKEMYNLQFRATNLLMKEIGEDPVYLGAKVGMVSVLHTWGADMKYHVHVHSLVTFGGIDKEGNWRYPKHKKRFCRNRKLAERFKKIYLRELKKLFDTNQLDYHEDYETLVSEVKDKKWSIFVTHPTMDTKTIELYLARYINRIAVTNARLEYIKSNNEVHLLYNDYRNQEDGEVAPKETKRMPPLIFLHQLLCHLPPPYFPKRRRYGIHANSKSDIVKKTIATKLKRHGRTIRTVMEIISHLMHLDPFVCQNCGSEELEVSELRPDKEWIKKWIKVPDIRGPDGRITISQKPKTVIF